MTAEMSPPAAVEDPGEPVGRHRRLVRVAGLTVLLLTAVVLGVNAASHTTLVFAAVMLVAALPLMNGRPVTWIALAITVVWTSRLLTVAGPAPRFVDFLDFVLVIVAFIFAGIRYLATDRRLPPAQQRICRRVMIVTVVIVLSWAFNDLGEPQRLIAGAVMALESFLLLIAVMVTPMTTRERRMLLILTITLLCGQIAFSAVQIASGGIHDQIKGTLLDAGAGPMPGR